MAADVDCEFCHEATDAPQTRDGRRLCESCADGWDYQASLTPEERRAEEVSMALYVDEWSSQ